MLLWRFITDESGATAIEYALLAGFVCLAIAAAADSMGTAVQRPLNTVAAALP